jgi:serine protease inhibitor
MKTVYDNKKNIKRQQSNKINDYSENISRLLLERDNIFEQNSNIQHDKNKKFGEITGDEFDTSEFERGLPIRSQYSNNKKNVDNNRFDFDLFDNKPSNLNVANYDQSLTEGNEFADISSSMAKMSSQLNPISICSSQIQNLNDKIYDLLFDLLEGPYIVNGIGLFNLFASLFFSSSGVTEIELTKFFGFPTKEDLFKGLIKINNSIENINEMVRIKNFIVIGSDVPYQPNYYEKIKDFCVLVRINNQNIDLEAPKMNNFIDKIMGHKMKNTITPENLQNLQLMLISTSVINPIWATPFDKITSGIFQGYKNNYKVNYLHSIKKSFGYFENDNHKLLEIKCMGNNLIMGFLLFKNQNNMILKNSKLNYFISQIRESIMDDVRIPMFENDFKLRYNSSLKKLGLNSVFKNMHCPQLFPENIVLHDIVHNVKIIVNNNAVDNKEKNNKNYISNRSFICDHPFFFYFRVIKTDTIFVSGIYQ